MTDYNALIAEAERVVDADDAATTAKNGHQILIWSAASPPPPRSLTRMRRLSGWRLSSQCLVRWGHYPR
jgi:hypothetical protein